MFYIVSLGNTRDDIGKRDVVTHAGRAWASVPKMIAQKTPKLSKIGDPIVSASVILPAYVVKHALVGPHSVSASQHGGAVRRLNPGGGANLVWGLAS